MWPGSLYTDNNDDDNDTNANDDTTTQLHKVSLPLAKSAKICNFA